MRKKLVAGYRKALILSVGVIATVCVSILFTEVGKRLIFDCFVPMIISLSACLSAIKLPEPKKNSGLGYTIGSIACIAGLVILFGTFNNNAFKDCKVEITTSNIYIHLNEKQKGGWIEFGNTTVIDLKDKNTIELPNQKNDPSYAVYVDADGNRTIISKIRQIYSTEILSDDEDVTPNVLR